jgi:hypothetical protein
MYQTLSLIILVNSKSTKNNKEFLLQDSGDILNEYFGPLSKGRAQKDKNI